MELRKGFQSVATSGNSKRRYWNRLNKCNFQHIPGRKWEKARGFYWAKEKGHLWERKKENVMVRAREKKKGKHLVSCSGRHSVRHLETPKGCFVEKEKEKWKEPRWEN